VTFEIPAEKGATQPSVVTGLGYPNGRIEVSPAPTGWQASKVLADGAADQGVEVESIQTQAKSID
jgi:hypothetical protein